MKSFVKKLTTSALILSFALSFSTLSIPALQNARPAYAETNNVSSTTINNAVSDIQIDEPSNNQLESSEPNGEDVSRPDVKSENKFLSIKGETVSFSQDDKNLESVLLYDEAATNRSDAIQAMTDELVPGNEYYPNSLQ